MVLVKGVHGEPADVNLDRIAELCHSRSAVEKRKGYQWQSPWLGNARSPSSESGSCGEGFAGHCPLERFCEGAVEVGDEGFDAGIQVVFGGEAGAAKEFAHEDGESDLDLVEPGSMLGVK